MPGNTVKINECDALEWYVGDSKMDDLSEWLEKNGLKTDDSDSIDLNSIQDDFFKGKVFLTWLEELVYPGKVDDFVQHVSGSNDPDKGEWKMVVALYTSQHKYQIVAIDRRNDKGYLGCQVSTRTFRAGEDWLRGNDLPDGPFNRSTWTNILNAIIRYELVELSKYRRPDEIPIDIDTEVKKK